MKCAKAFSVTAAILVASCSPAESGPQPSFGSAENNIAFAVSAICAPYVLDQVSEASLPIHRHLVRADGWSAPIFASRGVQPVRVGFSGFVHVGVSTQGGVRTCDITSKNSDPQMLRKAALAALATRPEHFAPTQSRYLPGRFASEDMLCAGADSSHPEGFVLLSASHPEDAAAESVIMTMEDGGQRLASCDQAGVQMNYRTLAP
jgi:hypothetical protein